MEIIINIGTHGATHYTTRLDTGDPRHTGTQMCDPKMTQHHGGEDRKLEEKKREKRENRARLATGGTFSLRFCTRGPSGDVISQVAACLACDVQLERL